MSNSDLRSFLQACVELAKGRPSFSKFMLEHGRSFTPDKHSFIGGARGRCFRNSLIASWQDSDLIYTEGYVLCYGVPIEHAWTVTHDGRVRDFTIPRKGGKHMGEYFGVPMQDNFVLWILSSKRTYQVFDWMHPDLVLKADPAKAVYDLQQ